MGRSVKKGPFVDDKLMKKVVKAKEEDSQKIIKTGPKNVTTGMCPLCQTIGRIFIIGNVGEERAKCPACNQEFDL